MAGSGTLNQPSEGLGPIPPGLSLDERYRLVRQTSEWLAAPLTAEDATVQSMPDVSPTKWHLAHVTWFFETFLLDAHVDGYKPFDTAYRYLFNSYYNRVGEQFPRARRGLITRPGLGEVLRYREYVDEHMVRFLETADLDDRTRYVVEVGLNHEQQHQELLLMDIKHVFSCNPLYPAYDPSVRYAAAEALPMRWIDVAGGIRAIGHDAGDADTASGDGFAFDNESPRHDVLLRDFRIGSRLITNGEYRAFIEDGGYARPEFWFMDGIETVRREGWDAPAYWRAVDGDWFEFTLGGLRPLDAAEPVAHVSYYAAAAYAAWAGCRLATEAEWECAAALLAADGSAAIEDGANLLDSDRLHPAPAVESPDGLPVQMIGDLWEWTSSAYANYPGFAPAAGAVGEYNGKFMTNQMVLRGGCCATPPGHIRGTYRNF